MFKLIDALFDRLSAQLAENFCENLDIVEHNRSLREQTDDEHSHHNQDYVLEI